MTKNLFLFLLFIAFITTGGLFALTTLDAQFPFALEQEYQKLLLNRVAEKLPRLVSLPSYTYPNEGFEKVASRFPKGKVLLFGYGSLMNRLSASRSVKNEALESMCPCIAFGVKRLFNYKAVKTQHWGEDQDPKEKAMLNIAQTLNIASLANGVMIEVDAEDFGRLVQRETGYDLVPILVASWNDIRSQNPEIKIHVAYTFAASQELRNHINYTSTKYYPVRGYLHAVQEAALIYGVDFARMWNSTTYLADGTTKLDEWDEKTFADILCTFEP
jgi:hypothetical protein